MAWNIMLFNKTFHVEHIYFSIHVPRKFTTPHPTPNRYVERGEGYIIKIITEWRWGGWGYYIHEWRGRGIKNYNYNRYRALYPHLNHSLM